MDRIILKRGIREVGAVWHLYDRQYADAIRRYLQEKQQRNSREVTGNPIHDQVDYLDADDRKRLTNQSVHVRTVMQLLGDIVHIPAGCVHQVQNLNTCVKLASDFISPQSLPTIVQLVDQFRLLPCTHVNTLDKLQVAHVLFQVIKNSVARF